VLPSFRGLPERIRIFILKLFSRKDKAFFGKGDKKTEIRLPYAYATRHGGQARIAGQRGPIIQALTFWILFCQEKSIIKTACQGIKPKIFPIFAKQFFRKWQRI